MIISRTFDMDAVRNILTYPGIWETISHKGQDIDAFSPPVDDCIYLIDNEAIGLFVVHPVGDGWKCHVQVLPEHREESAVEFGQKVIQWIWDNTEIDKLLASIPEIYPNVKKFSEIQGFTEYGKKNSKWLISIDRGM